MNFRRAASQTARQPTRQPKPWRRLEPWRRLGSLLQSWRLGRWLNVFVVLLRHVPLDVGPEFLQHVRKRIGGNRREPLFTGGAEITRVFVIQVGDPSGHTIADDLRKVE